jgi:PilZ domain
MLNGTVHRCLSQKGSCRGSRADSLGYVRHASGPWNLRCEFGFGQICNPLRSFVHLGARPMRQAMQSLSTFDGPERRSRIRFPIALAARYTIVGQQEIESAGKTVNISSHGALIRSPHEALPGTSIGVVIDWPILLGSVRPLALHIHGTVIRFGHGLVAVRISTHEFRTQPKPPDQVQNLPKWRVRSC